jgi:hypothetical protein
VLHRPIEITRLIRHVESDWYTSALSKRVVIVRKLERITTRAVLAPSRDQRGNSATTGELQAVAGIRPAGMWILKFPVTRPTRSQRHP